MMARCPSTDELMRLVDGEVTENRALQIRDHLGGCSACREELDRQRQLLADIRAPRLDISTSTLVSRIVERTGDAQVRAKSRYAPRAAAAAAAVACLGLVFLLVTRQRGVGEDDAAFRARGGPGGGLSRYIGLTLSREDRGMQRLEPGARVAPDAAYVMTYRNLYGSGPVYLLCFAVDSAQVVHWLYPAYLDAQQDPPALELAPAHDDTLLPESVMLARPAAGPLRFISIVSTKRQHVSSIERLAPEELRTAALRARFSDASITEISVEVSSAP
jgi:hypothetical protein